jgi:hypothetical protein
MEWRSGWSMSADSPFFGMVEKSALDVAILRKTHNFIRSLRINGPAFGLENPPKALWRLLCSRI